MMEVIDDREVGRLKLKLLRQQPSWKSGQWRERHSNRNNSNGKPHASDKADFWFLASLLVYFTIKIYSAYVAPEQRNKRKTSSLVENNNWLLLHKCFNQRIYLCITNTSIY